MKRRNRYDFGMRNQRNHRDENYRDENEGRFSGSDRVSDYDSIRGNEGRQRDFERDSSREKLAGGIQGPSNFNQDYGWGRQGQEFGRSQYGSSNDQEQSRGGYYGSDERSMQEVPSHYDGDQFRRDRNHAQTSQYGRQSDQAYGYGNNASNLGGSESYDGGSSFAGSTYGSSFGSPESWGRSTADYGHGYGQSSRASSRRTEGQYSGKGPKGYCRSDERIREEVSDALTHDPSVDASDIDVTVEAGVVTLKGTVNERRMKRLAEDCVEQI